MFSHSARPRERSRVSLTVVGVLASTLAILLALVWPAHSSALGEFEPNDHLTQAYGPLAGGTAYTAFFETENDVDWYRFYVTREAQLDLWATAFVESECIAPPEFYLRDGDGVYITDGPQFIDNEISHAYLTLDAGLYHLEAGEICEAMKKYRFGINTLTGEEALTTNEACGEAHVKKQRLRRDIKAAARKLKRVKEKVKNAAGKKRKRKLRRKRKKHRRVLRGLKKERRTTNKVVRTTC